MNHTILQSAVSIESLAMLSSIISKHGDDNALKALAGILAESGKPKTAEAVLAARREALIETPNPKNLPPLPLQWWVFRVEITDSIGEAVENGVTYVRDSSMNRARHIAIEHARATWAMHDPSSNQRIEAYSFGTAEDTSPTFDHPETVFTLGARND